MIQLNIIEFKSPDGNAENDCYMEAGALIGTSEEYEDGTSPDKTVSIQQVYNSLDKKHDKLTITNYTSSQVSAGINLQDNEEISISGSVDSLVIISATGAGIISFVAHEDLIIVLPSGTGWSGGDTPRFVTNKLYNVVYYRGSFYVDGGR